MKPGYLADYDGSFGVFKRLGRKMGLSKAKRRHAPTPGPPPAPQPPACPPGKVCPKPGDPIPKSMNEYRQDPRCEKGHIMKRIGQNWRCTKDPVFEQLKKKEEQKKEEEKLEAELKKLQQEELALKREQQRRLEQEQSMLLQQQLMARRAREQASMRQFIILGVGGLGILSLLTVIYKLVT
jgi:hypothetical protein